MAEVDIDRIKAQVAAANAARAQDPLLSGIGRLKHLPTGLKPSPDAAEAHARKLAQAAKIRRGQVQAARPAAERDDRALPLLPPPEIVQPAYIAATDKRILVQENLAPDDNWLQVEIKITAKGLSGYEAGFFYSWTNPTQDAVGLSVDTLMGFVGSCSAKAKRGFWKGSGLLEVGGHLNVYESHVINVPGINLVNMSVDSLFWHSEFKSVPVDALIDLSYDLLSVPAGGMIVVEASAYFIYQNQHAEEHVDFEGPFFRIINPNMTFTPYPIILT